MGSGLGASPAQFPHFFRTAVQSKVYSYPSGCSWLWLSAPRPLCIQQRPYSRRLICFEIWNLIATRDSFIDAGNWFYLMLCEVVNYNDFISATDSLEFIIYISLMYRLWKILWSNMSRLETFGMTLVILSIDMFFDCFEVTNKTLF